MCGLIVLFDDGNLQVERLEEELEGEVQIKKVLQCAINNGPALACCESCSSLYPLLPLKVNLITFIIHTYNDQICPLN